MQARVSIPVEDRVYKFMVYRFGSNEIEVSKANSILFTAYMLLDTPDHYFNGEIATITHKKSITLIAGQKYSKMCRFYTSDYSIRSFNTFIMGYLREAMYSYIDQMVAAEQEIKASLIKFRDRYDITEDEWSYDTMKKDYYRYRKEIEQNLSRNCPLTKTA